MDKLRRFEAMAVRHLNEIADNLPEGMQMALVAYTPTNPEADIVLASGPLEDVRSAVERRIAAAEVVRG